MRRESKFCLLSLSFIFVLSGCVVRTYPLTRDRVDQDLTGNRGYIKGKVPAGEVADRKTTRTTRVIEVELHSPLKFDKMNKNKAVIEKKAEESSIEGNRGYITQSAASEISEPVNREKYTVEKGDTLQKISQKFYGTTKKWNKIFEANKEKLKAPNKVYPGQVLEIPVEGLKETKGNLK